MIALQTPAFSVARARSRDLHIDTRPRLLDGSLHGGPVRGRTMGRPRTATRTNHTASAHPKVTWRTAPSITEPKLSGASLDEQFRKAAEPLGDIRRPLDPVHSCSASASALPEVEPSPHSGHGTRAPPPSPREGIRRHMHNMALTTPPRPSPSRVAFPFGRPAGSIPRPHWDSPMYMMRLNGEVVHPAAL